MIEEKLEKDYYADRPTEPYSDDDSPNDWANIAHYAEENLEKAFKRIAELEKENAFYEKACEGATMMYKHLTKARKIITEIKKQAEQFLKECEDERNGNQRTNQKA